MLGSRIAALRCKAGLSQAALARKLNISSSAIGMYEQGRREPSVDIVIALAKEFGVSIDLLVTGHAHPQQDYTVLADTSFGRFTPSFFTSHLRPNETLSRNDLIVLLAAELAGEQ